MPRSALVAVLAAAAMASGAPARADDAHQWPVVWINPGFYAHHFSSDKGLRERDFGFGLEVQVSSHHGYMAGSYSNSVGARSRYAGAFWRLLEWRPAPGLRIAAAASLAAIDGYPRYRDGGWFVAPLPVLSFEGKRLGLNIVLVPTIRDRIEGALAFQVKLKVW